MMRRRPVTSAEVARLAGVSQSAVSRAFTPGASVSAETRAKVEQAAQTLGYRPNAIARSLITRRSRIVGVAMAYLDNQFYPHVLEALSARLQDDGYQLLLFTAPRGRTSDPVVEQILRYRVDGMILASTTLSSAIAAECQGAGIPVVMLNRVTDEDWVASVAGDNAGGGRAIAEFLVAGGHRRFAYVAGVADSSTNRDRFAGFAAGLAAAGLPPPVVVVGDYTFAGAAAAARALLDAPEPPDAIFAANDHMAVAVMDVARHERGLAIPRDLSVVGFDDTPVATWPSYALTSYSQPVEGMVEAAVATLRALLDDPDAMPGRRVVPGRLMVRGSARVPRGWKG